jgi:plasmid maintenance system antidote protein VapI
VTKKLLDPIPPGEILLEEFMKPLGINIERFQRGVGTIKPAQGSS